MRIAISTDSKLLIKKAETGCHQAVVMNPRGETTQVSKDFGV
jgi:hypothetical protein